MLAVVEEKKSLLIFPANFEGIERSPHIIYCRRLGQPGGPAGGPLVLRRPEGEEVLRGRDRGGLVAGAWPRWPRTRSRRRAARSSGESYLPMVGGDVDGAGRGDPGRPGRTWCSTCWSATPTSPFYAALRRAGLTPEKLPVMAFNVAEDELRRFPPGDVTGHYAAWSYFQSLDRPENREFVRRFKARYGEDRAISDAMVAAYNGVMIWAQAADEAGTGDPKAVLQHFDRQSLDAPEGIVTIDPESRVGLAAVLRRPGPGRRPVRRRLVDRQADPPGDLRRHEVEGQWHALLDELKARWGGRWSSSEPIHPNPTPPARGGDQWPAVSSQRSSMLVVIDR